MIQLQKVLLVQPVSCPGSKRPGNVREPFDQLRAQGDKPGYNNDAKKTDDDLKIAKEKAQQIHWQTLSNDTQR
jgi:hypothetical protein